VGPCLETRPPRPRTSPHADPAGARPHGGGAARAARRLVAKHRPAGTSPAVPHGVSKSACTEVPETSSTVSFGHDAPGRAGRLGALFLNSITGGKRMTRLICSVAAAIPCALVCQVGAAAEFFGLGGLGGEGERSGVPAISDLSSNSMSLDGSVVAGYAFVADTNAREIFVWTRDHGMVGVGQVPGSVRRGSDAANISGDGQTVFGVYPVISYLADSQRAGSRLDLFRWTRETGPIAIGPTPAHDYFPTGGISSTTPNGHCLPL
jgi:hypothetical protein